MIPRAAWLIEEGLESLVPGKIKRSLQARFSVERSTEVTSHFRSGVQELGLSHERPSEAWAYNSAPDKVAARITELIGRHPLIGAVPDIRGWISF